MVVPQNSRSNLISEFQSFCIPSMLLLQGKLNEEGFWKQVDKFEEMRAVYPGLTSDKLFADSYRKIRNWLKEDVYEPVMARMHSKEANSYENAFFHAIDGKYPTFAI